MVDLVKRDPLRGLFAMPRWFDEFDDFSSQRGLKVRETENNIVVEAVVAGVPAKDVEIDIENGVLTIKAEKKEEVKKKGSIRSSSYQYYYTVALSHGEWNKANAETEDGVLTVRIPKAKAARKRKISVKSKKAI